jgi:hypothetical protein
MQYSPKLKTAMEEIKAILAKHDIGAMVVLHTPGHSEFLNKLNPSYSCIIQTGDHIRFKSKLADYGGDKKAWQKKTTDSLNLLQCITETAGNVLIPLFEFTQKLENALDAENNPGGFSSHTTQNN